MSHKKHCFMFNFYYQNTNDYCVIVYLTRTSKNEKSLTVNTEIMRLFRFLISIVIILCAYFDLLVFTNAIMRLTKVYNIQINSI